MSTVRITIWGMTAALVLFTVVGIMLFAQALRPDPRDDGVRKAGKRGLGPAFRRYIGPVESRNALLNPPLRVGLELVCASCGVPGLGWMVSTRVNVGLPMLAIVPSLVYGFYPVLLALNGHILDSPLEPLRYLPFLGAASASALAVAEWRTARRA